MLRAADSELPSPHLTPMDVQNQEFASGWRGFRKEEVRSYLLEVAQALEVGLRERAGLLSRIQALQAQVQKYRDGEDELRRTLVATERISHELREQARQEAELTVREAENRAALTTEQTKAREQDAAARHESRLRELEAAFSLRRAQLEALYQAQEHDLETRARDRNAVLEREFSLRHADFSGRLSAAHAEYAQFMSQYRAVSQAFAQAANLRLLPENPGLPSRIDESRIDEGKLVDESKLDQLRALGQVSQPPSEQGTAENPAAAVIIEEQRFS